MMGIVATMTNGGGIMNDITTLISGIGFPIVAYLLMVRSNKELQNAHREEIESLNKAFNERMERVTEALDKNTEVIDALKSLIK